MKKQRSGPLGSIDFSMIRSYTLPGGLEHIHHHIDQNFFWSLGSQVAALQDAENELIPLTPRAYHPEFS